LNKNNQNSRKALERFQQDVISTENPDECWQRTAITIVRCRLWQKGNMKEKRQLLRNNDVTLMKRRIIARLKRYWPMRDTLNQT